jgi:hypothetical protein
VSVGDVDWNVLIRTSDGEMHSMTTNDLSKMPDYVEWENKERGVEWVSIEKVRTTA